MRLLRAPRQSPDRRNQIGASSPSSCLLRQAQPTVREVSPLQLGYDNSHEIRRNHPMTIPRVPASLLQNSAIFFHGHNRGNTDTRGLPIQISSCVSAKWDRLTTLVSDS